MTCNLRWLFIVVTHGSMMNTDAMCDGGAKVANGTHTDALALKNALPCDSFHLFSFIRSVSLFNSYFYQSFHILSVSRQPSHLLTTQGIQVAHSA